MEKLKPIDRLTTSRCKSEYSLSDPIPPDVLMEIISRFPAKFVAKCRCVSKMWALILGRPQFEELILTKSLSRPQFLFAFLGHSELPFFTSPQIQNPNHDNSSSLSATPHYLSAAGISQISRPVRGWVCIEDQRKMLVICNPLLGKSITLPNLEQRMMCVKSVLGYDPIDKQYKVLCTTWSPFTSLDIPAEHYVLTLGTEHLVWRTIIDSSCKPLRPVALYDGGICINGVLYYLAMLNRHRDFVIVCFDIRSEKLSFIKKPKDMWRMGLQTRLINHNGQLGIMQSSDSRKIDGNITSFGLWVLKDIEKHGWTSRNFKLRRLWFHVVGNTKLCIVGMAGTCEIVLSLANLNGPFYLYYYNLERNIVRRVEIQGFEGFIHSSILADCFLI